LGNNHFSDPTAEQLAINNRTCLFVVNGLGLGNSTRCHAVMEHLADSGCHIHVLTSGNGLAYFRDKRCVESVTSMESFYYSGRNGWVSGWATFKSLWSLAAIAKSKREQLTRLLARVRPDVAVIDSEYTISPLRRRHIPVVALNTSEMVVSEYLKGGHPSATRSHFWLVEFTDYLFHKHFCDLVLSPFPLRTPTRHRRFRRIGLIARQSVRDKAMTNPERGFPAPRDLRSVIFMLSGSVHASNIDFDRHELPFRIEVVGRSGESRGNLTYHGRQMDNTHLLAGADALVINAGYSAVSEAFVLRKPVFVVPVPGHAEQSVNARLVQDLGLGFVATEQDVLPQLLSMYQQNHWSGLKPMPQTIETNGAQQAAQAILSMAARSVGRQSLRLNSLISKDGLGSRDRAASRPSSV
jgi:UDP:flavonoid glycosyltransferase YjiC (YdhE family)